MDELIDFPCSALWNSYYAERGLTTIRHSTDPRRPVERTTLTPISNDDLGARIRHILELDDVPDPIPVYASPPMSRPLAMPYRGFEDA